MKMKSLEQLHKKMLELQPPEDMQHFRLNMGAVDFDCFFSTRGWPYSLALTSRGEVPEFFCFPISEEYSAPNMMEGDAFRRLARVLRTTGKSGNKLIPKEFFAELDTKIPTIASRRKNAGAEKMTKLQDDLVDGRAKLYFTHWKSPGRKKDGTPKNVSDENQKKTLERLGSEALAHSRTNQISSCWSPILVRKGWQPNE